MAKVREEQFSIRDFPVGEFEIPERLIPDSAKFFYYEFARCTDLDPSVWANPNTTLSVQFEGSSDGGKTWIPAGGFTAGGGIVRSRQLLAQRVTSITIPLPPGTGRLIRGRGTVSRGVIRTAAAVEFRDSRDE